MSSPGSTTHPKGLAAVTSSSAAREGAALATPAITTGRCGGATRHCSARLRSSRVRRAATSISPSSASRAGQAVVAISRNSAEARQCRARSPSTSPATRPGSSTSSICTESRNPASASASSNAAAASIRLANRC